MNCRHFKKILIELARDGFSSTQNSEFARQHAASCSQCAKQLKQQQVLTLLLRSAAGTDIQDNQDPILPDVLRDAFASHHHGNSRKPPLINERRLWTAAALVLIAAIAGSLSYHINQLAIKSSAAHVLPESAVEDQDLGNQIATEFIPLMEGETSLDRMQVVRVRLPRSALLQLGLPMNETREEESILADVLVSEDGLPYAIRFINHQKY